MSTAPEIVLAFVPPSECDLNDTMIIMQDAFDPEYGEAWSWAQCQGLLAHRGSWADMVTVNGDPAGFAMSRIIVDEAELLLIGVRPLYRGLGIGSMLIDKVCQTAQAKGAIKVHLEMREGNLAEHLYKKYDFYEIGRRKRYYRGKSGRKFDAITWSRDLAA